MIDKLRYAVNAMNISSGKQGKTPLLCVQEMSHLYLNTFNLVTICNQGMLNGSQFNNVKVHNSQLLRSHCRFIHACHRSVAEAEEVVNFKIVLWIF